MRTILHMGVRLMILLACAAAVTPLSAQRWNVSAHAGEMRSTLDPADATTSIALGLQYDAPTAGLRISTGLPTSSVESLWAGAGAWKRAALRRSGFLAGVDLAGNVFITRDRSAAIAPRRPPLPNPFNPPLREVASRSGHALAGQAMPVIGYEGSRMQLHARAGVSHYIAEFGDVETDRTVRLADLTLTLMPTSSFAVLPVVRRYEAAGEDDGVTYAGASAVIAHRIGSVWASAGHWLEPADVATPWSAGASLRVHPRTTIDVSARHDTFDPLYMQPSQTSWNAGLSFQIGGPVGTPAPPVPAEYVDGRATIRLPVSASPAAPAIAGDFNGWRPAPMQRTGDDWTYTIALDPGVYNYSFVSDDGTWFVPENVPGRRDDGMGGHVAVLVVQ